MFNSRMGRIIIRSSVQILRTFCQKLVGGGWSGEGGVQKIMVLVRLLVQPIHLLPEWAQSCGDVAEFRPSQNQMKH